MKYVIDSANIPFIKKMLDTYACVGVTTNPTIIIKEQTDYWPLLKELSELLKDKELHIQLNSEKYEGMIEEAKQITSVLHKKIHLKIPSSPDGFKAMKHLSSEGYSVTATAVCSVHQGIMAAHCGAEYIAVYVNRISNTGLDGNSVIKTIKDAYKEHQIKTLIIGASYKNVQQVTDSLIAGVDQVTVSKDLFEKLFDSNITNQSIKQFTKDYNDYYN